MWRQVLRPNKPAQRARPAQPAVPAVPVDLGVAGVPGVADRVPVQVQAKHVAYWHATTVQQVGGFVACCSSSTLLLRLRRWGYYGEGPNQGS